MIQTPTQGCRPKNRQAWQFDNCHETNSSPFTDTEAILERDSTLHTNALRPLPRPISGTLVVILCCRGPFRSCWGSTGGQKLRSKSPTWPSPLSSQELGLHQLNVLCQSAYKAHVTFAVLLNLDIFLTPFNDDFIIFACLPVLLFNLSLHL